MYSPDPPAAHSNTSKARIFWVETRSVYTEGSTLLKMLTCALCNEWTVGRVCSDCVVVRHSMTLYGREVVLGRIRQIFVRHDKGLAKQTVGILSDAASTAVSTIEDAKAELTDKPH